MDALTGAPTITHLLGAGDPYLAFTRLQHHVLEEAHERTIRAAAAALGMSSEADTVLGRLEDGAHELSVDQRHARRLSDEGLAALASLIASSWLIESVPALDISLVFTPRQVVIAATTTRPTVIAMSEPAIEVLAPSGALMARPEHWHVVARDREITTRLKRQAEVDVGPGDHAVVVVWRGEVWPKFAAHLVDAPTRTAVESLGNKLMVRFSVERGAVSR